MERAGESGWPRRGVSDSRVVAQEALTVTICEEELLLLRGVCCLVLSLWKGSFLFRLFGASYCAPILLWVVSRKEEGSLLICNDDA
jgi:hypothetical protein